MGGVHDGFHLRKIVTRRRGRTESSRAAGDHGEIVKMRDSAQINLAESARVSVVRNIPDDLPGERKQRARFERFDNKSR